MKIVQYPYVDDFGVSHNDLIKTFTNDPNKILKQVETGILYKSAVDVYPCQFTYEEIDDIIEDEQTEEMPGENITE